MPNLPLCLWSSQLFDLRAQSSTDVLVLLLNQPNKRFCYPAILQVLIAAICLFISYKELKIAQTVQINQLFKLLMYANEFKTKEKQKLTELKKLTATYTTVHLISAWVITSPPPTQVLDQVKWSPSLKAEGDWEKT